MIRKKYFVLTLLIILIFTMSACKTDEDLPNEPKELSEIALEYAEISHNLNMLVKDNYWYFSSSIMANYLPNFLPATLWPYTVAVASVARLYTLYDNYTVNFYYKDLLDGFEYYRNGRDSYLSYSAGRSATIGTANLDVYYDDNVWVSREFLNAYELLEDETYLSKAISVAEYIYSGWANDEIGGIYWHENTKESRNTCSNAPASLLFSRLYVTTGQTRFLEWAKNTYDFCYNTLLDTDYVYKDNISNDGVIDNRKYTYNTGSMIAAGIHLYEITNDIAYLNAAKNSAKGSFDHFFKEREGYNFKCITSTNPWFNLLLLDGYIELYRHDKTALTYIETYKENLDYAYENNRNEDGFVHRSWIDGGDFKRLDVLDMAGNAENYGLLSHFYRSVKIN